MKTSILWFVVLAFVVVLLFALARKGDVKASISILGAGFSLETTEPK